jgi:tight adherence protein B
MVILSVTAFFFVFVFLIALIVVAVASQIMDRQTRLAEQLDGSVPEPENSPLLLREDEVSSISAFARFLQNFDFIDVIRAKTAEADLDWSVGRVCAMILLCGAISSAVLTSISWMPLAAAIFFSLIAALSPYFYILRLRRRKLEKFEKLFPEALDSLVRAVRAGHPFAAGMEVLAGEALRPVATEMRKTLDEWKLGMSWNQALDNLTKRVPLTDVSVFVAAVKLQMRTGGRLGEVLSRLAESMRESGAIQGEVRALAAHGKTTGFVLSALPVGIALVMFYVNPDQMLILLNSQLGRNLIAGAVFCLVVAHVIIRQIVNIRP